MDCDVKNKYLNNIDFDIQYYHLNTQLEKEKN